MTTPKMEAPKRFRTGRAQADAAEALAALDALTFEEMTEETPAEAPQPEPIPAPAADLEDDDLRAAPAAHEVVHATFCGT